MRIVCAFAVAAVMGLGLVGCGGDAPKAPATPPKDAVKDAATKVEDAAKKVDEAAKEVKKEADKK